MISHDIIIFFIPQIITNHVSLSIKQPSFPSLYLPNNLPILSLSNHRYSCFSVSLISFLFYLYITNIITQEVSDPRVQERLRIWEENKRKGKEADRLQEAARVAKIEKKRYGIEGM